MRAEKIIFDFLKLDIKHENYIGQSNCLCKMTRKSFPLLVTPFKHMCRKYGPGENAQAVEEEVWCGKGKVHNSNSSSSAKRNFLTSIKQVISSSILPENIFFEKSRLNKDISFIIKGRRLPPKVPPGQFWTLLNQTT